MSHTASPAIVSQPTIQHPTQQPAETTEPQNILLPGITPRNGFRFRRGQQEFLAKLATAFGAGELNQLGVFVPGYGKTITALSAFVVAHAIGVAKKLVVFVPRGNLRDQYADPQELNRVFQSIGAPRFSFCVADSEKVFLKNIETSIIITTYQYASGRGGHKALLHFCQSAPCMFVFDEVHHLSDDGTWATKIDQFPCAASVALSGTPMRSDNKTLFGVPFELRNDGEQYYRALHEVTMRDAHAEGEILKRVQAHVIDYRLKLAHAETGQIVELSLSQMVEMTKNKSDVDAFLARRKLRFHEVYLESLLAPAFQCFAEKRRERDAELAANPAIKKADARNHQMLIIAMSNRHAEAILEFVQRRFPQWRSARIGQDVPAEERQQLLEQYRNGQLDVMAQVDMIGEGTDIKPISVIVKADLVRAYSKTLQQIFRGMRYYGGFGEAGNVCDIYAANDSEVVTTLEWITSEEQIGVRMKQERERHEQLTRNAAAESGWELRDVEHRNMQRYTLELFPELAKPLPEQPAAAPEPPQKDYILNVSQREHELRQECASLASRLSFILKSHGQIVEINFIHGEAKRRFSKSQEELSINELVKKKDWLERCIAARRLVP